MSPFFVINMFGMTDKAGFFDFFFGLVRPLNGLKFHDLIVLKLKALDFTNKEV